MTLHARLWFGLDAREISRAPWMRKPGSRSVDRAQNLPRVFPLTATAYSIDTSTTPRRRRRADRVTSSPNFSSGACSECQDAPTKAQGGRRCDGLVVRWAPGAPTSQGTRSASWWRWRRVVVMVVEVVGPAFLRMFTEFQRGPETGSRSFDKLGAADFASVLCAARERLSACTPRGGDRTTDESCRGDGITARTRADRRRSSRSCPLAVN